MSRRNGPEPFFRADRGLWYVQVGGRQHNLGTDERDAVRRWHALMARPEPVPEARDGSPLVVALVDEFLSWNKTHRAARTFNWYRDYLQTFVESLPDAATFPVSRLRPHHVERWVSAPARADWGASYRHGAIRSVQRCFRWAEKQGYIDLSPVRHIEKPTPARREQVVSPDEFRRIVESYPPADCFRDVLEFTWEVGARPQETCIVAARHYRPDKSRIEIPPDEAKGKRWRVIYLTDRAEEIVARHVKRRPTGPIFLNEDGKPWTSFSTNCRFMRLRDKIGVKYCLYSLRHSYAQRMLEAGLDSVTVAALLGHSNANMLNKVYSHMDQAKDYLAERVRKFMTGEGGK